ncbi:MAG: hypothetical protein E7459_08745 [Ruminococcaceae bacterium]|nr:hypothetical protein [Oscillospiraceae bacterium]
MYRFFLFLVVISLWFSLISGCAAPPDVDPSAASTAPISASIPPTSPNQLATTPLQILSWDAGRAEDGDKFFTAETQSGFYLSSYGMLFYGDKSDLSQWVPVCTKADCLHEIGDADCDAFIGGPFVLQDDRIFYLGQKAGNEGIWAQIPMGVSAVMHMAPDGSDKQIAHIFGTPEGVMRSGQGSGAAILTDTYCLEAAAYLNPDGAFDVWITLADESGEHLLYQATSSEADAYMNLCRRRSNLFGDTVFVSRMMDSELTKAYRLDGQTLRHVELGDYPCEGAYLSEDILWFFRPGEGYFSANLTTGEETMLAENRLDTSVAYIVLPNCILESNLIGRNSATLRENSSSGELHFFNGQEWQTVALPDELQDLGENGYLEVLTVASDRILFLLNEGAGMGAQVTPCQILLDTDTPTLELLGTLNLVFPQI